MSVAVAWSGLVATTSTTPTAWAGVSAVAECDESTCTSGLGAPPIFTDIAGSKPDPVRSTSWPPPTVPDPG